MASSARTLTTRASHLLRTSISKLSPVTSPLRRNVATFIPRRPTTQAASSPKNVRFNSTSSGSGSNTGLYATLLALGGVGGGAYYLHSTGQLGDYLPFLSGLHSGASASDKKPIKGPDYKATYEDYQEIYNEIAELLESNPDYDDGSYAPVGTILYILLFMLLICSFAEPLCLNSVTYIIL